MSRAAERVAHAELGPGPHTIKPRVPVVAVTGTNGKTTTSRMIAHLARADGRLVGWSNTDGIYVDGALVEAGDYSGPSGAGRVLAHPGVELAVTETARGGILLKGIGLTRNDVSVVTNVSADHLGLQGIDTVDQLAEVKAVVPRITRKDGWAVLNADDPRVYAMRAVIKAQPWVFGRDPDSPAIRETPQRWRPRHDRDRRLGDACCVPARDPEPLIELVDVPMTLAGLSRFNVENTLAAASAALAVGIPRDVVVEGLRTFLPDAEHNPGRMNFFTVPMLGEGEVTVVIDLAHNEAGLEALIEIMNGVRRPGGAAAVGPRRGGGPAGRPDREAGRDRGPGHRRASRSATRSSYLRGRTVEELDALLRAGAERVGVTGIPAYPTEVACLSALVGQALPGDVVGLMCHAQRAGGLRLDRGRARGAGHPRGARGQGARRPVTSAGERPPVRAATMPDVNHGDRRLGPALLALAALLLVGCAGSDERGPVIDGATTAAADDQPTLVTPDSAGEWSRVTSDAAQDNAKAYLIRAEEEAEPGTSPLFAEYERDDGATMAFLGLNVDPGSEYAASARRGPGDGRRRGARGRRDRRTARPSTPESSAVPWRAAPCHRSTASTASPVPGRTRARTAQVTLVVPQLDYEEAARLTRDFREAVTDR